MIEIEFNSKIFKRSDGEMAMQFELISYADDINEVFLDFKYCDHAMFTLDVSSMSYSNNLFILEKLRYLDRFYVRGEKKSGYSVKITQEMQDRYGWWVWKTVTPAWPEGYDAYFVTAIERAVYWAYCLEPNNKNYNLVKITNDIQMAVYEELVSYGRKHEGR